MINLNKQKNEGKENGMVNLNSINGYTCVRIYWQVVLGNCTEKPTAIKVEKRRERKGDYNFSNFELKEVKIKR